MEAPSTITEFIFFHVPESVIPEDTENAEGKKLLEILQSAKSQEGHCWSAWGRTEEDPNALIWVIGKFRLVSPMPTAPKYQLLTIGRRTEWANGNTTVSTEHLRPFMKRTPEIVKLRAQLTPSLLSVGGINSSPITDITTIIFSTSTPTEDVVKVVEDMKEGVTQKIPENLRPSYYCVTAPHAYPIIEHPDSPTGKAVVNVVVVGWESSDQHYAIWKTPEFKEVIPPVRALMLPYAPGIGMKHTPFQML